MNSLLLLLVFCLLGGCNANSANVEIKISPQGQADSGPISGEVLSSPAGASAPGPDSYGR